MSERDKPPVKPADAAAPAKTPATAVAEAPGEPFLKRWSRLKREDEAGDAAAAGTERAATADGEALAAEEAAIDPADLPDVESLDKDSDYTVFMQAGVPDELRTLALRKLFMSNPAFAVLDGLNDYDDDYSTWGIVARKITTAYKAGRGYLEDEDLVQIDEAETESEVDADGADVEDIEDDDEDADAVAAGADGEGDAATVETTTAAGDVSDEAKPTKGGKART